MSENTFFESMKPWKTWFDPNSSKQVLRCATTSQFFFKFWPPAPSRCDQAHKLFLFLFPVSQRTPLREQVVSCFCFRNPYEKTHRWGRGYRDSARLLGESCIKKLRSHLGKKIAEKSRNSCQVNGRGCGSIGTVDSVSKCSKSYNEIQTLKECLFCHICCSQLCAHLRAIVTGSRTVSNRESLYPRSV